MAIGTPTGLGTNTATAGTTVTLTTSATAPSGSLIILTYGWGTAAGSPGTISTVSGGGLTWVTDVSQAFSGGADWGYAVISAQAPSGLASGTAITITISFSAFGHLVAGLYCTGLATSTPKDISDGQGQASATAWDTTATTTTVADTLVIGGSVTDGTKTNTPSGGATELYDFQYATEAWALCTEYKILSATASTSLTGTWSGGAANCTSAFAAYKADTTAVAGLPDVVMGPFIPS